MDLIELTAAFRSGLPQKLNLGCGFDIRPGYLNVDGEGGHGPDLVADITNLAELPEKYFSEIVAQDVLEHIPRHLQVSTVKHWATLLTPTGVLHVRVPSLFDMVALAREEAWQNEERQSYFIQMVYGTQAYQGDYHRCGYTPWTVAALSRDAGLVIIQASLRDGWLYDLCFKNENAVITDDEFLQNAYFTLAHRIADENGRDYWLRRMKEGTSRTDVIAHIIAGERK